MGARTCAGSVIGKVSDAAGLGCPSNGGGDEVRCNDAEFITWMYVSVCSYTTVIYEVETMRELV